MSVHSTQNLQPEAKGLRRSERTANRLSSHRRQPAVDLTVTFQEAFGFVDSDDLSSLLSLSSLSETEPHPSLLTVNNNIPLPTPYSETHLETQHSSRPNSRRIHPSLSSDSDSDDDSVHIYHARMPSTTDTLATVSSTGPNKVPVLSSGELTIEVFLRWKHMCEDFFELKEIDNDNNKRKIVFAVTGLQDILVKNWYRADENRLKQLTWTEFSKEFRDRWLPQHWEQQSRNELTRACQLPSESFKNWVVKVETLNANLVGTDSHKSEAQLREHIMSMVCDRLSALATAAGVKNLAAYKDWKNKLIDLDNERLANMNEILRLAGRLNNASVTPPWGYASA